MIVPNDFNEMLHWLRSQELQQTGQAAGTMVSVGASDLGYFNWIDDNLGKPTKHIGLEFYRPRPETLPDHVMWIANTAGNMCDVESQSADLVFAGQTIEHLWFEELAGFFAESARVLKVGGRLIFDSPNRIVSNAVRWNHPEHTVELTPDEAVELCALAGFEVKKSVGHWLCAVDGTYLPLTEVSSDGAWPAERRVTEGRAQPDRCFSWWIEAERTTARSDVIGVFNYARQLSQRHFDDRLAKLMQTRVPVDDVAISAQGQEAWLVFGPNAPLPPGRWLVRFNVEAYDADVSPGRAEVIQSGRILGEVNLPPRFHGGGIDVPLVLDQTEFGLEFRLWSNGAAAMRSTVGVEIYRYGIA